MKPIQEPVLHDAITAIITARDFCGDEKRAVMELAMEDHGMTEEQALQLYAVANFKANGVWNFYQRQAGVKAKYLMGGGQ